MHRASAPPPQQRFTAVLQQRLPKKGATAEVLLQHHAAALGLAAVIQAFPYEMPTWLPEVVTLFAVHMNDPAPIQVTFLVLGFWVG